MSAFDKLWDAVEEAQIESKTWQEFIREALGAWVEARQDAIKNEVAEMRNTRSTL